jgi:glycine/D-amino acid oxidase-like deaminating enzyme
MPIDVLIVGQGLAGSLLAWELLQQDMRVLVVDPGEENASKVAAGLINPVTGQRLVKTAGVDFLLPAAVTCYQALTRQFKKDFFVPMDMLRVLKTPREQHYAQQRLQQIDYQDFLSKSAIQHALIQQDYAVLLQQQTGYLKTRLLLTQLREYLIAKGCYRQTKLQYTDIRLQPQLHWQDLQPRQIVFCEGHQGHQNPWFGNLPFQLAKGEILTGQASSLLPKQILNFGYWLIPLSDHSFRVGATFEPGATDINTSIKAKHQLLEGLTETCPSLQSIQVTEHRVGIRPATLDKQPFIGRHPRYSHLHIFNGFGAKGSLMIPWYARQFALALKQQTEFTNTGHVQRYHETHFPH